MRLFIVCESLARQARVVSIVYLLSLGECWCEQTTRELTQPKDLLFRDDDNRYPLHTNLSNIVGARGIAIMNDAQ